MLRRVWASPCGTWIRQSQSHHTYRICGTGAYIPSASFRFINMLLSPLAFAARLVVILEVICPQPPLHYAGISYAPTWRTILTHTLSTSRTPPLWLLPSTRSRCYYRLPHSSLSFVCPL